jgi:hypothetical protein
MRPERVRSEFREFELGEAAILFIEYIFNLLVIRFLFQLNMHQLLCFFQTIMHERLERERGI